MTIIDFRNTNVSEFRFSIMGNSNVDSVYLFSKFVQYATDCSIYLKVESIDEEYVDKIAIASENISIVDGALLVKWLMGAVSTQCKKLRLQLQFEKEGDIIAQTRIVYLTLGDTIDVSQEMEKIYPDILKYLQKQIDTEHDTNQTQQQEIDNNTNKLNGIESGAQVNVIESVVVNGTPLVPSGKAVSFNVPTKTSDLTNDSDFTTKIYVDEQIEKIEQRSDVVDVVGTYADLMAYDTSTLAPNSLIKVINDENHDNEITYYRWVITQGVGDWVYVASEGAYYTATQIDTMLGNYVSLTGNQTITGIKTFNNEIDIAGSGTIGKIVNAGGNLDFYVNGSQTLRMWTTFFRPTTNNAVDLGNSSYKWKNLYLSGSIYGNNLSIPVDAFIGATLNFSEASANAQIKWTEFLTFSKSANTTFTFETAKSNCLNEYKALITNSGSSAIVLTFTGVVSILCNDDNIAVSNGANSTLTLPSGVSIEISCLNNRMVAINFDIA